MRIAIPTTRLLVAVLVGTVGSRAAAAATPAAGASTTEVREVEAWRALRTERLTSENGWLTLVGLHWLKAGANRFGTAPDNEVVLPAGSAPPLAGTLRLEQGKVRIEPAPGAAVTLDGKPVGERELRTDAEGAPDEIRVGRLRLTVILRGDRYGVRAKDPTSPARTGFRGLDYFPIRDDLRIVAEFVPYDPPKEVRVATVLGTTDLYKVPGLVRFALGGREVTLEPVLEEPDAKELFFIFRDRTSGQSTYEAGRFLYTDLPKDGKVVLDFNRAYNPPCAFTPYATCPLPPRQNSLDHPIEAGEKTYRKPHGGASIKRSAPAGGATGRRGDARSLRSGGTPQAPSPPPAADPRP